ncbi:PaaX family transcriptional regulator C-terminal domain-containing protein [Streptomyces nogalater]
MDRTGRPGRPRRRRRTRPGGPPQRAARTRGRTDRGRPAAAPGLRHGRHRRALPRLPRPVGPPRPLPSAPDDLARQLLLHTDWLQAVRSDPRLPAEHLPADWPAIRAEHVFRTLSARYDAPARQLADTVLDTIPAEPTAEQD